MFLRLHLLTHIIAAVTSGLLRSKEAKRPISYYWRSVYYGNYTGGRRFVFIVTMQGRG